MGQSDTSTAREEGQRRNGYGDTWVKARARERSLLCLTMFPLTAEQIGGKTLSMVIATSNPRFAWGANSPQPHTARRRDAQSKSQARQESHHPLHPAVATLEAQPLPHEQDTRPPSTHLSWISRSDHIGYQGDPHGKERSFSIESRYGLLH